MTKRRQNYYTTVLQNLIFPIQKIFFISLSKKNDLRASGPLNI